MANRVIVGLLPKYAPVIHTTLASNDISMPAIKKMVETNCKYIESTEAYPCSKPVVAFVGEKKSNGISSSQ